MNNNAQGAIENPLEKRSRKKQLPKVQLKNPLEKRSRKKQLPKVQLNTYLL
jgi:hypothetical protein